MFYKMFVSPHVKECVINILFSLTFLIPLKPFTVLAPKIKESNLLKKVLKFPFIGNCFTHFFTAVESWYKKFRVCLRMLFKKIQKILAKIWLFLTNLVINKSIKSKRILQTVSLKIFWDFSMSYQIFFSPQVKWCTIILFSLTFLVTLMPFTVLT